MVHPHKTTGPIQLKDYSNRLSKEHNRNVDWVGNNSIYSYNFRISGRYKIHAKEYDVITSDIQVRMDIKCLQILRAIVYNEFVQIDPEEKERDPESYKR